MSFRGILAFPRKIKTPEDLIPQVLQAILVSIQRAKVVDKNLTTKLPFARKLQDRSGNVAQNKHSSCDT